MLQFIRKHAWAALTGLATCAWFLTDVLGAASRLDEAVNDWAPVVAALLPFLAVAGVTISLTALLLGVIPWLFEKLPKSVKIRFAFYRNSKVKEIQPALNAAMYIASFRLDGREIPVDETKLYFLKVKLEEIDIKFEESIFTARGVMRAIAPFVEDGSYEHVRRICENFRKR